MAFPAFRSTPVMQASMMLCEGIHAMSRVFFLFNASSPLEVRLLPFLELLKAILAVAGVILESADQDGAEGAGSSTIAVVMTPRDEVRETA